MWKKCDVVVSSIQLNDDYMKEYLRLKIANRQSTFLRYYSNLSRRNRCLNKNVGDKRDGYMKFPAMEPKSKGLNKEIK